jgi:hypothetical protein
MNPESQWQLGLHNNHYWYFFNFMFSAREAALPASLEVDFLT